MSKKTQQTLSFILLLAMTVSLFSGLSLRANAAQPASAGDVTYHIGNPASSKYTNVVANWGTRGTNATFLTTYAQKYYTGSYSYGTLSALDGTTSTSASSIYGSALGTALHSMLTAKQTKTTSYDDVRYLCGYTDCQQNDYTTISSYYSGENVTGYWDSGKTWNREHTWPNSKGLDGSDENDIMMLRPTSVKENSSRGNNAYGEGGTYYDPNIGSYNVRGDVARLMLQHLIRWGNTGKMFGTSGTIKDRATLIQWMEEDPVDTWEMGRNDAVQSITGVRNVFVDYPELAFQLLGATMPSDYPTPSGGNSTSAYTVTASSNNTSYGTVSVSGNVITASPKTGYYASGYTVTSGTATVVQDGNTFTVTPSSNCSVRINFAVKSSVTITFSVPAGVTQAPISGYQGDLISLPTPSGTPSATAHTYTFAGWVTKSVTDSETAPTNIYAAGGDWTMNSSMTLYALYTYRLSGGTSAGDWTLLSSNSDLKVGMELLLTNSAGSAVAGALNSTYLSKVSGTFSGSTVNPGDGALVLTLGGQTGAYTFANASGKLLGCSALKSLAWDAGQTNWTISISDGNAVIKNANSSYGTLQYNSGATRFTTYTSAMQATQLYGREYGTTYYTTVLSGTCDHVWNSGVVTAPTCTAAGYTTYTCTLCGETKTEVGAAATGHKNGSAQSNQDGTHTFTCTVCGSQLTKDCTYTSVVTAPTATEQGYTTYTCTACKYSYKGDYTDPLGVDYTVHFSVPEGVGAVGDMTCNSNGSITLPAVTGTPANDSNHASFVGWVSAPVDNSTAKPEVYAAGTSYTASSEVTLYALYSYSTGEGSSDTWTLISSDSDLKIGMELLLTSSDSSAVAGELSSSYLTKVSGTFDGSTVTVGEDALVLTLGGQSGAYTFANASGQLLGCTGAKKLKWDGTVTTWDISVSDGTAVIASTTASYGSMMYNKSYPRFTTYTSGQAEVQLYGRGSGTTYYTTQFSPAEDCQHTNTALVNAKAATCTEAGYTGDTVCQDCGAVIATGTAVPALGHDYQKQSTVAPTCTEEGYSVYVCSRCKNEDMRDIVDALGHTEGTPVDNGDGTHTVSCTVCQAEIRTEAHTFVDGTCACGAKEAASEPTYDASLKFLSKSFTMGSSLNMVFIASKGTDTTRTIRAEVTKYNADGTTTVRTYTVADGNMNDQTRFVTFTFDGVAAKEMGDKVEAKLFATDASGNEFYGETLTLSLKDFLMNYAQSSNEAQKNLAVALLNYGAAAQVYFDYNYDGDTTKLVNNDLTEEQKVIDIREASATTVVSGDGCKCLTNSVLLESKIVLYAIFNLGDYSSRIDELAAVVTNAATGEGVTRLTLTKGNGTLASFRFDDVSAKNTRTVFNIAIYDGETKISQDLQWSMECMVSSYRAASNTPAEKLNLANAMLAYGDYAAAYLG